MSLTKLDNLIYLMQPSIIKTSSLISLFTHELYFTFTFQAHVTTSAMSINALLAARCACVQGRGDAAIVHETDEINRN